MDYVKSHSLWGGASILGRSVISVGQEPLYVLGVIPPCPPLIIAFVPAFIKEAVDGDESRRRRWHDDAVKNK